MPQTFNKEKVWIQELYESRRPEAVLLLKTALRDPDEQKRLFAAQALELLDKERQELLEDQEKKIAKNPEDRLARLTLADLCEKYADLFAETKETQSYYRRKAKNLLMKLIDESPSSSLRFKLGRLLFVSGEEAEGQGFLEAVAFEAPEYVEARLLLADIALRAGRLARVREECRKIQPLTLTADQQTVVDFWCHS